MAWRQGNNEEDASAEYTPNVWERERCLWLFHHVIVQTIWWMEAKKMLNISGNIFRRRLKSGINHKCTWIVFSLIGASNLQKTGAMLWAFYTQVICFHWGEHVLLLIFSDLSKLKPIQVSYILDIYFLITFFWKYISTLFYTPANSTMCLGAVQTMPSMNKSLCKVAFSTMDARLVCCRELEHALQHGSMPCIYYFDRKGCWKQQSMEQHFPQW